MATTGQHQDAGGKVVHFAPNTSSSIVSKSISKNDGRSSYRGLVKIYDGANHAFNNDTGANYKKEAADDAWARVLAFFGTQLKA